MAAVHMATAELPKRKLEEEKPAGSDEKRAAAEAALVPMEVDGAPARPVARPMTMRNEDFSPELLRVYYERMFPFLGMYRWLRYGNDPHSTNPAVVKDYFLRREFTFVLEGDVYCRYQCFRDMEEYKAKVLQQQPVRMEIGAVYTHPPKNHSTVIKDAYKPVERELVFDIDMDDYDCIRTCCTGSKLCTKCWSFMKCAVKTLGRALREDFGFQHILFVYSGRRGVHCWVCDGSARRLSNEQRSAVVEYLNLVTPGANKVKADFKASTEELHPSIEGAYGICEKYFKGGADNILVMQDILQEKKSPHLENILELFSTQEKDEMRKYMNANPGATSLDLWNKIEKIVDSRPATGTFKQRLETKHFLKSVVVQFTYPRLDINVSKQMNHLLKSPFVVHPKTGRVCVPIDPSKVDEFNPLEVPTIGRLVDELNASGDATQTSLKPYITYFETQFLKPLELQCLESHKVGVIADW